MIDAIAPYLTTRAFVGGMIDAGWGRIVNVTSAASLHPPGALNSAYATAKVALRHPGSGTPTPHRFRGTAGPACST